MHSLRVSQSSVERYLSAESGKILKDCKFPIGDKFRCRAPMRNVDKFWDRGIVTDR